MEEGLLDGMPDTEGTKEGYEDGKMDGTLLGILPDGDKEGKAVAGCAVANPGAVKTRSMAWKIPLAVNRNESKNC